MKQNNETIVYRFHTKSLNSATFTFPRIPIAKFELPRFKFMKKLAPIYFYTTKEVNTFLKKLPKEWRTFISLTSKSHEKRHR